MSGDDEYSSEPVINHLSVHHFCCTLADTDYSCGDLQVITDHVI
jgi:hypothetical protein